MLHNTYTHTFNEQKEDKLHTHTLQHRYIKGELIEIGD